MKKIIIGLGTGRCGTRSLAHLLDIQASTQITHQREPSLPWKVDDKLIKSKIDGLLQLDQPIVGDVATYYLPYIDCIQQNYSNVYFICLKRDKQETINSFSKWTKISANFLLQGESLDNIDPFVESYPKYDVADQETAMEIYWDNYYQVAEEFAQKYDNFRLFSATDLNYPDKIESILDFLEIPNKIIQPAIRLNTKEFFTLEPLNNNHLNIEPEEVLLFANVCNNMTHIPYFLKYHRELGVNRFFIVDNGSEDETRKFLMTQPDVIYFFTTDSFKSARCGLLWLEELRNKYGIGNWCLTLDIDEMFVYPWSEYLSLQSLCKYLDSHNYQGIYTFILDMYSKLPIKEAHYTSEQPFLETCDYFDSNTYFAQPNIGKDQLKFPPISIRGGVRWRVFWENGTKPRSPTLRKIPLVKWQKDIEYLVVTHRMSPIRLADITGAIFHFKFFSDCAQHSLQQVRKGQRTDSDAHRYVEVINQNPSLTLYQEGISTKYENTTQLVKLGLVKISKKFIHQLFPEVKAQCKNSQIFVAIYEEMKLSFFDNYIDHKVSLKDMFGLWYSLI